MEVTIGHNQEAEIRQRIVLPDRPPSDEPFEATAIEIIYVLRTQKGDVEAPEKVVQSMIGTLETQRRNYGEVVLDSVWSERAKKGPAPEVRAWRATIFINGVRGTWFFRWSRLRWQRSG